MSQRRPCQRRPRQRRPLPFDKVKRTLAVATQRVHAGRRIDMRATNVGFVIAMTGSLAGCATIVNGRTVAIPIASNPPGAQVTIDSVPVGTTPLVTSVLRRTSHVVRITYDTFPAQSFALTRKISPLIWTNAFYYMLTAPVDFATGSAWTMRPDTVMALFGSSPRASARGMRAELISPGTYLSGFAASSILGMGVGHRIVGRPKAAKRFMWWQVGSMGAVTSGLVGAFAGQSGTELLIWGGFASYGLSRLVELVDLVVVRANPTNAPASR